MRITARSIHGARAAAFLFLTAAAAPACGSDGGEDPMWDAAPASDARALCYSGGGTPAEGAEVELGTGQSEFVPVEDDDEVALFAGLQGGYHVFGNARVKGLDPGGAGLPSEANPATWFTVSREDGTVLNVSECAYPQSYREVDGDTYGLPYGRIVQVAARYVPDIYGERVRIKVEALDSQGRYASDEHWVVIVSAYAPDAGVPPVDAGDGAIDAAAAQ